MTDSPDPDVAPDDVNVREASRSIDTRAIVCTYPVAHAGVLTIEQLRHFVSVTRNQHGKTNWPVETGVTMALDTDDTGRHLVHLSMTEAITTDEGAVSILTSVDPS